MKRILLLENYVTLFLLAVGMETRVALYYLPTFREIIGNHVEIQQNVEITGSRLGFATANEDLYHVLQSFFDDNRENLDIILNTALKRQVRQ